MDSYSRILIGICEGSPKRGLGGCGGGVKIKSSLETVWTFLFDENYRITLVSALLSSIKR